MKPFLQQVANLFFEKVGTNIEQYIFVFPSRRAGVFFQRYLAQHATTPFFAPTCYTLSDLFSQLAPQYQTEDRLALLLRLYSCFKKITNTTETFDSFVGFGETLLKDFNDIDNYLVDASAIFTNLSHLNELTSFDYLTDVQKAALQHYLGFIISSDKKHQKATGKNWQILGTLYQDFTQSLLQDHLAYDGLLHRIVCEMSELSLPACEKIVFVGFNALDGATKTLFTRLNKLKKADFYWDYQSAYIQDKNNKAHFFMEENIKNFPSIYELALTPLPTPAIKTIAIPSYTGQAKYVAELIKEKKVNNNTALVLANENLLVPMLHSIPPQSEQSNITANITMGYPLQQTNIIKFIETYILLHSTHTAEGFYHAPVWSLLQHPFLKQDYNISDKQKEWEEMKHFLYIKEDKLQTIFSNNTCLKQLFTPQNSNNLLLDLVEILSQLSIKNYIEQELLQETVQVLKKMHLQLTNSAVCISMKTEEKKDSAQIYIQCNTLMQLIKQALGKLSFSFIGQPTQGLQVMGILETRCLDFENVIITSFNDGIYPQKDNNNTYIPYNIRSSFGLPTNEHQDAIYAYNFYRLIQRANKVFLLYDTRNDSSGSATEVSRFVQQLKYIYNHRIESVYVNYNTKIQQITPIKITHKESIGTKVKEFLTHQGLSPTALRSFLECPLKFYFSDIEKINIEQELTVELQSNQFGSIYHYVMEQLYKPFVKKSITKDTIQDLIKNNQLIDKLLQQGFVKILYDLKDEEINNYMPYELKGIQLLTFEIIKDFVVETLHKDAQKAPFILWGTEQRYNKILENSQLPYKVKLKGTIDRIDKVGDNIHLIDYKTGKYKEVNQAKFPQKIEELFDVTQPIVRQKEILQMCFYKYLYAYKMESNILTYLYFVKNVFNPTFIEESQVSVPQDFDTEFEPKLIATIQQMLDTDYLTTPTPNEKHCKHCHFKDICGSEQTS